MLLTEEDAAKKWCHRETGVNRTPPCIGSSCMAWRAVHQWRIRSDHEWETGTPQGNFVGPNNQTRTLGYCGLAGKVDP